MKQLPLFGNLLEDNLLMRSQFSHAGICSDAARASLEKQYSQLLLETTQFNRRLVSFQANKMEMLHSWMKYREGFSAGLVDLLLNEFNLGVGDTVFDPFAGSATTLLVAGLRGIDGVGIELLPHCHLAWDAKSRAFQYDVVELKGILTHLRHVTLPPSNQSFPHLTITESAFPRENEIDLMAYTHWVRQYPMSEDAKILCKFILLSILEDISYTRKDGQYLRWDRRADKIVQQNRARMARGQKPINGIHKGALPTVKQAFLKKLREIILDVEQIQKGSEPSAKQRLIRGNLLYELPGMPANQFAAVITSPPYANRYDYTRTYALELAYMNVGSDIFDLRQQQLSCTVENKSKSETLTSLYTSLQNRERYVQIQQIIQDNPVLAEVNAALQIRNERGEINNRGVLTMIAQYFAELTFVLAELHRVCLPGGHVAFVNDNVRYAGEVIPVDLISTNLAEQVGFRPVQVYVLPQRKGNSSQQMGKFGREPLRKSITVWQKPKG